MTACDIHGFLTLSSRLQSQENAIEIGLPETMFQRRKVPNCFWIITRISLEGPIKRMSKCNENIQIRLLVFPQLTQ